MSFRAYLLEFAHRYRHLLAGYYLVVAFAFGMAWDYGLSPGSLAPGGRLAVKVYSVAPGNRLCLESFLLGDIKRVMVAPSVSGEPCQVVLYYAYEESPR